MIRIGVADLGNDFCSLESPKVVRMPIGENFKGDTGESVGVPQQRLGLSAQVVGERTVGGCRLGMSPRSYRGPNRQWLGTVMIR